MTDPWLEPSSRTNSPCETLPARPSAGTPAPQRSHRLAGFSSLKGKAGPATARTIKPLIPLPHLPAPEPGRRGAHVPAVPGWARCAGLEQTGWAADGLLRVPKLSGDCVENNPIKKSKRLFRTFRKGEQSFATVQGLCAGISSNGAVVQLGNGQEWETGKKQRLSE